MNFCVGFDPPTGWCPKNCWVYGGYIELTMATMGKVGHRLVGLFIGLV